MARWLKHFSILPLLVVAAGCCKSAGEPRPDTTPAKVEPAPVELTGAWDKDVKDRLTKLIAEYGAGGPRHDAGKPPVVVFDFDNTTIRGDIGRAFFDWMTLHQKFKFSEQIWQALPEDKRGGIKEAWEALQKLPAEARDASKELQEFRKRMHQAYWSLCRHTDPARCYPWQVRFYAGYTPDEIRAMAERVFEYELGRKMGSEAIRVGDDDPEPAVTSTGLRIHKEIQQLMEVLDRRGFQLWVVTAGPQWVVQGAARHFKVRPDRMIGMRTVLGEDGELTTEMEPPPTFRQGKVEAIKKFIGVRPVLVLGDSWTDAEMLAYGENAVLVDKGYADLKKKAFDSGWWIQPMFPVE